MTQAAQLTPRDRQPVQRQDDPKTTPLTSANPAIKGQLRGMSFAEGEAALTPGGGDPVQRKSPVQKDDKTKPAQPHDIDIKQGTLEKLGQVESFEQANTVVGQVLDAMAPTPSSGFMGAFEIKICPPGAIGFYMNLGLEGTVKRTAAGKLEVEGKLAVTVGVGGGGELDAGWLGKYGAKWHVGIRGALGVKATGSHGGECMSLTGLAIKDWIDGVPGGSYVSPYLFGETFEADVLKGMGVEGTTDEDSIESSMEGGLDVGGSLEMGELASGEAQGFYGGKSVTKVGKGKDGKKTSQTEVGSAGFAKFNAKVGEHWHGEGEVQFFNPSGPKKPSVEIKAEVMSHGTAAAGVAFGAKSVADLVSPVWGLLKATGDQDLQQGAKDLGSLVPCGAISGALDASHLVNSGFEIILKFEELKFKEFALEAVRGMDKELHLGVVEGSLKGKTTRALAHGHAHEDGKEQGAGH